MSSNEMTPYTTAKVTMGSTTSIVIELKSGYEIGVVDRVLVP